MHCGSCIGCIFLINTSSDIIFSMNKAIESRPRVLLVVRAIVLFKSKILLIQRSKDDVHEANLWEIPGGKLDIGQDLGDAIEREVMEEAGIFVYPLRPLVSYMSDMATSSRYKGIPYIRLVGLYKSDTEKVRLSFEHQDFKWVSFEEALGMKLSDVSKRSLLSWEKELEDYLKE